MLSIDIQLEQLFVAETAKCCSIRANHNLLLAIYNTRLAASCNQANVMSCAIKLSVLAGTSTRNLNWFKQFKPNSMKKMMMMMLMLLLLVEVQN